MAGSENGGFRVKHSKAVGDSLRRLQRQATAEGRGPAFLVALRRIAQRLILNPTVAGEPLYRLPGLGLEVRTIAIHPLVIDFAVSEVYRIVFIKTGRLLS